MSWYRPAGSLATDGARVLVTPEDAGWTYSGLRVVDLAEGPVEDLAVGAHHVPQGRDGEAQRQLGH